MMGRRRNQIGLVVLAAVPVLIAVSVKSTLSQPGQDAPDFFRSITGNGLFVALAALTIEIGLFLPLAVSVIAGDSVAGEANIGTLRYLLTVPVTRLRLLLVKLAAITVGAFVATFTVMVTGVVMGLILFGGGSMTLLSGTQIGFGAALLRVVVAAAYLACGLAALGTVGLFVSTLTEQPIGAMVATVILSSASHPAGRVAAPLPADPPLAGLRRPVPRSDRLEQHRRRSLPGRGLHRGVLPGCVGQVHHQGRHQLRLPRHAECGSASGQPPAASLAVTRATSTSLARW
jgi:hypothetical protein